MNGSVASHWDASLWQAASSITVYCQKINNTTFNLSDLNVDSNPLHRSDSYFVLI